MNNKIRLLDCTLREAPLEGLMWGDMSIRKMIHGLELANVDIIEVGFLKDTPYVFGSTLFNRVEEIEPYLVNKKSEVMYVALVDYGRYNLDNLSEFDGKSIDAIRVCFKHDEIGMVLDYAKKIRDKGYKVAIQHVDTLAYSDEEILEFVNSVNAFMPYAYSIVDTFGAMYDDDMLHISKIVAERLNEKILLGFHGHNNLMLADANAQKFIVEIGSSREVIVDSSLYGCGRSAGNAHTELLAQFLDFKHNANYDINELLDLIDTVISAAQEKTTWGYSIPYFIAGMHNAHTFNVKQLLKKHNLRSKDLRGIIEKLDDTQKKAYDYALLEQLYIEYFDKQIDDSKIISKLNLELKNRIILLLAPGVSVSTYRNQINDFINHNSPIVIGVNNLIDGYKFDYIFFSAASRYKNLQYQRYISSGNPRLIISSNVSDEIDNDNYVVNYKSLIKSGWVNFDSSIILLFRLLIKCGVQECYIAGLDGFKRVGANFYTKELDPGIDESERMEVANDNYSMMKDLKREHPEFHVHFITDSIYQEIFL
ncbi:hypothetical protein [Butyrivibrio sp. AC2005]|uniref:hypothetical protein n=1 Tax=Butyrivibrio sp. AC2005 TaxID=1280672 RepID=UPI0004277378|nr:hypothetical protein [Butyrivibrio sp. AC2005]